MDQRNIVVRDEGGDKVPALSFVAVVVVAAVIALFVWQPWNAAPSHTSTAATPAANGR